jgi:hypothetical protein
MSAESLLLLGRIFERLLIVCFAGLSLWMGWKLFFKRKDVTDQTAEFSFKDIVIKLQKVAPGMMFTFFGAAVLGIALWQNLKASDPATNRQLTYLGRNAAETAKQLQALNLAVSLANLPANVPISPDDRSRFNRSATNLTLLRNDIVRNLVGPEKFSIWSRYNTLYQQNKADVPPVAREAVEEVFKLMQDLGAGSP